MKANVAQGVVLRFGVFELNLENRELRRKGLYVAIQPLAFNLLALLASQPDHLVTREQIRQELWPGQIAGDFNSRLNFVVAKLREALDDDAERPLYIKTVRGTGLAFIAPVTRSDGGQPAESSPNTPDADAEVRAADIDGHSSRPGKSAVAATVRRWPVVVAVLGTAGLLGAAWLAGRGAPPTPHVIESHQLSSDGWYKEGLCSDGQRLYFTEERPGGFTVVQLPMSAGNPQPVVTGLPHPETLSCNTKASELLVKNLVPEGPSPLWILPLKGGQQPRPLGISAQQATWSADGSSLAYSVGRDLYFAQGDGSGARKLASLPGFVTSISYEPGAKRITLGVQEADHGCRLWAMRTDGSGLGLLFSPQPDLQDCATGQWTTGGRCLLFWGSNDADPVRLWSYTPRPRLAFWRSSALAPLTDAMSIEGAAVLTSERKRAFVIGSQLRDRLLRYDRASGQWTAYLPGTSGQEADISRDGAWVVYEHAPGHDLWLSRIDGSSSLQLTRPPITAELPQWSPDGRSIAFLGSRDLGGLWKAYVISANGGAPHAVLESDEQQGAPTWSPDGGKLMFGELLNDRRTRRLPVIHMVDLKTGQASALPGSGGLWTARWSPNGRYVAALTLDAQALMLFDFRSQHWSELARADKISDLRWAPRSDFVYFNNPYPAHGTPSVLRVSLKERRVEPVADLTGRAQDAWLGLTPDGSPLIGTRSGTQEIYELDVNWP